MIYQMKLHEESFERMRCGEVVLELRLYDEKRQRLQLGDTVEFASASDLSRVVRTEIVGLIRYKTFAELVEDFPAAYLGYDESEKEYLKTRMYKIYTKEEEAKYGVLGIRVRLLPVKKSE